MSSIPYIDIHTHQIVSDNEILSIVNRNAANLNIELKNNQPYSIGIHPWDIEKFQIDLIEDYFQDFYASINAVAVGEIGLDKIIDTDITIQKQFFINQLRIAFKLQKPVIIHCVKAHEELLKIKQNNDTGTVWIYHGYNKNLQLAETLMKYGFYLSFGENLLKKDKLQSVFKKLPLDKVFLETDDKPVSIKKVYAKAAEIKGIDIDTLKKQMLLNYIKCF